MTSRASPRIWPSSVASRRPFAAQLEVDARYAAYVDRQDADVAALRKDEDVLVPADLDFTRHRRALDRGAAEALRHRPATLAQAGRIDGMTPAALMLLLAHLKTAPGAAPHECRRTGWTPMPPIQSPNEFREAFGVSRETMDRLELYERLARAVAEDHQPRRAEHAGARLAPAFRRLAPSSSALARSDARTLARPRRPAPAFRAWCWRSCLRSGDGSLRGDARRKRHAGSARSCARSPDRPGSPVDIRNARIENSATQARVGRCRRGLGARACAT